METLHRLQHWYAAQWNGEWEHQSGVQIRSLDNRNESLSVNLNLSSGPIAKVFDFQLLSKFW
ncbi:MAG: hypothetical protein JNM18_04340 [Planctomycetaceae bacterium]|nr:hypothetical protein [Planctomycetaceae bacterium]